MEKTTRSTRKSRKPADDNIRKAYITYLLSNGKQPPSVFKFCKEEGITEEAFYNTAGSFEALEGIIWKGFIDKTIAAVQADSEYQSFKLRERILTFYFALLEELKANRSFVLLTLKGDGHFDKVPALLHPFKKSFEAFIENLVNEGKSTGEIAKRPYLDKSYPHLFWLHMVFILFFWIKDASPGFEKTDAVVEKSVNLAFDLIGKGAVDSAIDFARFMYQSVK
ncbi:MAG: TetR/AcrR family transcriptional regulator [Flammeovirgaceae bacterium]|nr:MAG: TetR/AcrR family transcriptional regulator [Flammeovirgaceae bacterium]